MKIPCLEWPQFLVHYYADNICMFYQHIDSRQFHLKLEVGPRMEPCGTPHVSKPSSEKTPSSNAKSFLFERYDLNHLITGFLNPRHSIF